MQAEFGSSRFNSEDEQRGLRFARAARAVVGFVIVAVALVAAVVVSTTVDTRKPLVDASAAEFQLYWVPDAREVAISSPIEPSASEVDDSLKSLIGVTHHG